MARKAATTEGEAPTRALDRGLQILEVVARRTSATLAEIAAETDLSPATASRILRTLERRGFVSRDTETKQFRVGLAAFEVGSRFLAETRLQETCRLILRKLTVATEQSTTLAVLHRADIVYLDAHEGTALLRSTPQIGSRAPAHATASGKCLLSARWGEGLVQAIGPGPYAAVTERTITTADRLTQELLTVRKTGIAFDREELHPNISCMACPVHDRAGEVVASVAIQAPTPLMTDHADDWTLLLRSAAAESSLRLGWRDRYQDVRADRTASLTD